MKFFIDRGDLLHNIQHLANVVPSKNTMPILTNYLIEAIEIENLIKITTTDLKITVIVTFNATVMESGTVAVAARNFNEIITSLPDSQITFTKEDELLKIHCENIDFKLNLSDYSNFPLIPEASFANAIEFKAHEFDKMINKTIVAVQKDQHNSIFSGILWEIGPDKQSMVATDSKKIAHIAIDSITKDFVNTVDDEEIMKIVLPTGGISFLQKIISEESDILQADISKSKVVFKYRNFIVFSHLMSTKFPDYTKVFPASLPKELLLDKQQLKAAVKRISLFSPEDSYKIMFSIKGNTLELATSTDDKGGAKEFINDINYNGDDISIAFNFKFMSVILDCIDTDNVKICLGEAKNPALFYNEKDPEGTLMRYLLMPLRVAR
ncbi:MAG: DNA polymerase III subunit beta [Candidatus Cloacimonadales bacterium]